MMSFSLEQVYMFVIFSCGYEARVKERILSTHAVLYIVHFGIMKV